ncbi:N-acetylglucosamine kinase [Actinokineospora sp. G85]|uniref:N-acetylglucosamine kinase n=1 Tax=Actinokineospora sp. G85 TaxID=3406626 RepID=UPI003C796D7B
MNTDVVVGVDAGGTRTRAVAVDRAGTVLGRGEAGGANPNSHPPQVAAARMGEAIAGALRGAAAGGCVVGMAGSSKLVDPGVAALFHAAFARAGLAAAPLVLTDAEVAFASGTAEPDGAVVISGTGSIAMGISGRRRARTSGGFGWLLGDEGSAHWIGREAVRATLRALQSGLPLGALPTAVLEQAGVADFGTLIHTCNTNPPVHLATFAPLVTALRADPVAADIVERAALALAAEAEAAWESGPVVLAGSVAAVDNPVGARLRELLGAHSTRAADDGALGAAWLAGLMAFGTMPHPVDGA